MNSMERVRTAIGHKEPDRIPVFHLFSFYGAKELGISIKEYFSKPELVAKTQLQMNKKYSSDCLYTFFYACVEIEAFGGEAIFTEDGPPNSGEPVIKSIDDINNISIPEIHESKSLIKVLETTSILKKSVGDEVPIIGVVISPFSLPVMQMGFEKYLELLYFRKKEFDILMRKNRDFCINWANAQLASGATAICYFDPLSSPTIIEREKYLKTGHIIAKETISEIKGVTATHLASGIAIPVLDDIVETGSAVIGFSEKDNIDDIKKLAQNKICLLGNLNGIEMINWNSKQTAQKVKDLIHKAGKEGGFILSDNHGDIPWQVPEQVLLEISQTVKEHGIYPILKE